MTSSFHTSHSANEFKLKLTFYFWIESCLSSEKRNTCCFHLYASAGLWWCDLYVYVFMCLHVLDSVYHGAVRFITNLKLLPTAVRRLLGSHGLLCHFISQPLVCYYLWGCSWFASTLLTYSQTCGKLVSSVPRLIPSVCPKSLDWIWKKAFRYAAPSCWNLNPVKLHELIYFRLLMFFLHTVILVPGIRLLLVFQALLPLKLINFGCFCISFCSCFLFSVCLCMGVFYQFMQQLLILLLSLLARALP